MKRLSVFALTAILSVSMLSAQHPGKVTKLHFNQDNASSRSSSVFLYTLTTLNDTYTDLTGGTSINNGEIWDDPEYVVPIGFPFELNGNPITFLQFVGTGALLAAPTADPDILTAVFPFEMDLIDRGEINGTSVSPLTYKVDGPAGSRILKIEWENAGSYEEFIEGSLDMFINFQLWLYEGSNRIEFRFGGNNISDPALFYGGFGIFMGTTDADQNSGEYFNPHFFSGDINMPVLNTSEGTIEGTPSEGTVYRLSLDLPLEVTVTGTNGTSTCDPNGSATAEVTGGIEPYTYLWNNNETTQTISSLDAGTYTVTVTDDNGGTATGSVTITNASPVNPNASATDETSVDANDGTATSSAFGGTAPYTFEWSNGGTTQTIINLAPGLYTVTVTDNEGCTATQSVTVNAFGCPELQIEVSISDPSCNGVCDGSIQILDVPQGVPPFTYIWSNGSASAAITDLCAGDYGLTILDANGCSVSGSYSIVEPAPIVVVAGSTNETAQDANDGTAWATPSGGTAPYSYAWSNAAIDSLITGLAPGTYTVTVSDANMCSVTATVEVDSFACSLVSTITHNACFGQCDGILDVNLINAVDPITYIWADGNTLPYIDSLCAGTYSVTAVDGVGCTATGDYTITQPTELLSNGGSTDETAQGANDGTAWVTPTGGTPPYTYNWSNNSTDSLISNLIPGTYTVTVSDANGCESIENIDVNPFTCAGSLEGGYTDPSCYGSCDGNAGIVLIGGVGPVTYLWNTGDTTNNIYLLCEGTYTVTITDVGQNCVGTVSFDLVHPDSVLIAVDSVVHVTDSTQGSIFITISGGTPDYSVIWFDALGNIISTTEDLAGVGPGIYYPGALDANGCAFYLDGVEVLDETVGTTSLLYFDARLFPNPANEQVYIDIDDITGYQVLLRSFDGRVIKTWKEEKTLDVSSVPSGVYLLEGISGSKIFRERLVIAR